MRINCHVPITLRIVGTPTDAQLAAVGKAVTRAVAARLAEAERILARHHQPQPTLVAEPALFTLADFAVPAAPPANPPVPDPFAGVVRDTIREAGRNPAPRPPEPVRAGDDVQIRHVFTEHTDELWQLPRVQERIGRLAESMDAWERNKKGPGKPITYDAAYWLGRWEDEFRKSVTYILDYRTTVRVGGQTVSPRTAQILKLERAEAELLTATKDADVVPKVEELRRDAGVKWQATVDQAVDRFLVLAENEAQYLRDVSDHPVQDVRLYALPEFLEGTVSATAFPDLFEQDARNPASFSPSVARFIAAVRKEWGNRKVRAQNYGDHVRPFEHRNQSFAQWGMYRPDEPAGLYSFDVDVSDFIPLNQDGFYEHDKMVEFFLAVERAGQAAKFEWIALYNDASVSRDVNQNPLVRKRRILFVGATDAGDAPQQQGSIHHGPKPYILHVHFDIMPVDVAAQYFAGVTNPPDDFDLGTPP